MNTLVEGDFGAIAKGNYIECYPPEAENPQKIPRTDFQFMYENWQNYHLGFNGLFFPLSRSGSLYSF